MSPIYHAGQELNIAVGKTLFDYADNLKIRVPSSCGRNGSCHECIVEVKRGGEFLTPCTESESFLPDNYRLACQARPQNTSVDVEFATLRRQPRILVDSIRRDVDLDSCVGRSETDVYFGNQRLDSYSGQIYGLAVDLGTTTVVLNLVDLERGTVTATRAFENPQCFGGSDIMHRISYDGGGFHGELQQVILSAINFEIGDMSRTLGIHRRQIYDIVVVGNSAMRDIFFGVDVQPIGQKPYKSVIELEVEQGLRKETTLNVSAEKLGLRVFPRANVYGGPLIGCHIGSDVAAGLIAIGMDKTDQVVMLVDIGTNTEVVIGNRKKMIAASCPAGPAFEGREVTYGMPGYDGAIESVEITENGVQYRTIGDRLAQGICGSGLVDLLAELRRTGVMNELGVLSNGASEFRFSENNRISLSRLDISALAQAKSANYSGQYIVMRQYGAKACDIERLYLAGGFANYVNTENAIQIGFLAGLPADKVMKVGNVALEGATIMLLSTQMRRKAEELASRIQHVELESTPDFFDIFVEGCLFNPMHT